MICQILVRDNFVELRLLFGLWSCIIVFVSFIMTVIPRDYNPLIVLYLGLPHPQLHHTSSIIEDLLGRDTEL